MVIVTPFDGNLAEMMGIILGDGGLYTVSRGRYKLVICFNKKEMDYFYYVKNLFESFFESYKFSKVEIPTENFLQNMSVFPGRYLISAGMKPGNKIKNKLVVPEWIQGDTFFLSRFIRGFFDTDGCVYRKYDNYLQIQIKLGSEEMLTSVRDAFVALGFHPTKVQKEIHRKGFIGWKFYLCRQQEIHQFFSEIQPKNTKHLRRYQKIKNGAAGIRTPISARDSFIINDLLVYPTGDGY